MPKVSFKLHPDGGEPIGINFPLTISESGLMKAAIHKFGLEEVTDVVHFYDTKGATIDMLSIANLSDSDTILVAVPEKTSNQDLYKGMTRTQKGDTIRGKEFSGIEVTLHPEAIHTLLEALKKAKPWALVTTYSAAASFNIINENWGVDMSVFTSSPDRLQRHADLPSHR
jgi:hypothetical protein